MVTLERAPQPRRPPRAEAARVLAEFELASVPGNEREAMERVADGGRAARPSGARGSSGSRPPSPRPR